MREVIDYIGGIIWEPVLIYLCLGAGLFFSIATRFVQVRLFREMFRLLFSSEESDRGISSFQALAVSLSGRVGTGNIAGVAAAIGIGGPGAVFWMWVVAFLGASTAYVESTLAQIYKEEDEGQFRGGPAYYFEKGHGPEMVCMDFRNFDDFCRRHAAANRAIKCHRQCCRARFRRQSNSRDISWQCKHCEAHHSGALSVVVLGFIIFGGVKRIAHFTQVVVPFMALGLRPDGADYHSAAYHRPYPSIIALILYGRVDTDGGHWRRHRLGRQTRCLLE